MKAWPEKETASELELQPELDDPGAVLLGSHDTEYGARVIDRSRTEILRSGIDDDSLGVAAVGEDDAVEGVEEVRLELKIETLKDLRALGQ